MAAKTDKPAPMTASAFGDFVRGVTSTTRSVVMYQRADLLAEVDELERRLRIAEAIPKSERGMTDDTPETVRAKLDALRVEFDASAVTVRVRGMSVEAGERIAEEIREADPKADNSKILFHQIAASIIEPPGATYEDMVALAEVSQAQVNALAQAWTEANVAAPRVDPTRWSASSAQRRGATS